MKIQEVIDRVLTDSTGEIRIAPTCDQLMTGDPQQEVKGIAVTFMATVEVIREAAAKGVNFIITHEPTWFTGRDVPDWCAEDSTYLAKRRLIDETGMTIWRYHDHMHAAAGDRIYWGVADKLGWNQYLVPGQKAPWLYEIPQTTLVDLAADLKRKLDMTTLQTMVSKKATRPTLSSTRKTGSSGRNRSLRLPLTQGTNAIWILSTR